jgi:hypothetical protein
METHDLAGDLIKEVQDAFMSFAGIGIANDDEAEPFSDKRPQRTNRGIDRLLASDTPECVSRLRDCIGELLDCVDPPMTVLKAVDLWVWSSAVYELGRRGVLCKEEPGHQALYGIGFAVARLLWPNTPWGDQLRTAYNGLTGSNWVAKDSAGNGTLSLRELQTGVKVAVFGAELKETLGPGRKAFDLRVWAFALTTVVGAASTGYMEGRFGGPGDAAAGALPHGVSAASRSRPQGPSVRARVPVPVSDCPRDMLGQLIRPDRQAGGVWAMLRHAEPEYSHQLALAMDMPVGSEVAAFLGFALRPDTKDNLEKAGVRDDLQKDGQYLIFLANRPPDITSSDVGMLLTRGDAPMVFEKKGPVWYVLLPPADASLCVPGKSGVPATPSK